MGIRDHWESVYRRQAADRVSWYRPQLERSLEFLRAAGLPLEAAILDVGGGASTFADDLLQRGYRDITVLDISDAALQCTRTRLGASAARVQWIVGDVTEVSLPAARWHFWHDRAVFHFLTGEEARHRYVEAMRRALVPGGHVVIATFGLAAPPRCSGLDVVRFSPESLVAELGSGFVEVSSVVEAHVTPSGSEQEYVYGHYRMA